MLAALKLTFSTGDKRQPECLGDLRANVVGLGLGTLVKDMPVEDRAEQQRHGEIEIESSGHKTALHSTAQDALQALPGRFHHAVAPRLAELHVSGRVGHERGHHAVAVGVELVGRPAAENRCQV